MVTENGRLAEVTEAAERMGIIPPLSREGKIFNHTGTQGFTEGKHRGVLGNIFSVVFLCVPLCSLW